MSCLWVQLLIACLFGNVHKNLTPKNTKMLQCGFAAHEKLFKWFSWICLCWSMLTKLFFVFTSSNQKAFGVALSIYMLLAFFMMVLFLCSKTPFCFSVLETVGSLHIPYFSQNLTKVLDVNSPPLWNLKTLIFWSIWFSTSFL